MQAHSQELIEDYRKAIDQIIALRARVAELEYANASLETTCSAHCTVIAELEAELKGQRPRPEWLWKEVNADRDRYLDALEKILAEHTAVSLCSRIAYNAVNPPKP